MHLVSALGNLFCTHFPTFGLMIIVRSSLGEFVRPTEQNMDELVTALSQDKLPIGTFIIDDGWQDVRAVAKDEPDNQGLWGFGAYDGLGGTLKQTVDAIKTKLPTVQCWMRRTS